MMLTHVLFKKHCSWVNFLSMNQVLGCHCRGSHGYHKASENMVNDVLSPLVLSRFWSVWEMYERISIYQILGQNVELLWERTCTRWSDPGVRLLTVWSSASHNTGLPWGEGSKGQLSARGLLPKAEWRKGLSSLFLALGPARSGSSESTFT